MKIEDKACYCLAMILLFPTDPFSAGAPSCYTDHAMDIKYNEGESELEFVELVDAVTLMGEATAMTVPPADNGHPSVDGNQTIDSNIEHPTERSVGVVERQVANPELTTEPAAAFGLHNDPRTGKVETFATRQQARADAAAAIASNPHLRRLPFSKCPGEMIHMREVGAIVYLQRDVAPAGQGFYATVRSDLLAPYV